VAGVVQMRLRPMSVAKALSVWRSDLWPFGRWLFGSGIVYTAGSQTSVFVIGALLGTAAVGGLRAVQTVFAPLTLLSPAIALPALPTMTRKLATAFGEARIFALQLAGIVVVLTTVYVTLVGVLGADLLNIVFGRSFVVYENLILPVAVQQVIAAAGVGFDLLLRAGKRGRAIFGITAATGLLLVSLVAVSAWAGDLLTVAWSTAVVSGVSLMMLGAVVFGRAPELSVPEQSVRG
jgi:O-antigen/teichoic acid export membrane protein